MKTVELNSHDTLKIGISFGGIILECATGVNAHHFNPGSARLNLSLKEAEQLIEKLQEAMSKHKEWKTKFAKEKI